jgi:hypothetical protein
MAVLIKLKEGKNSANLLAAIKQHIADNKIRTWTFDAKTGFKHTAESDQGQQWNEGAYLKVSESVKSAGTFLRLYYKLKSGSSEVASETYGTLNGRFAGMVMNHFADDVFCVVLKDLRK